MKRKQRLDKREEYSLVYKKGNKKRAVIKLWY